MTCSALPMNTTKWPERAARAGIQQGLHNEEFELSTVMANAPTTSCCVCSIPSWVKFQFQVSTISRGYDAAEYFAKYPDRFFSMHVQGWSAQEKKIVCGRSRLARLEEIFNSGQNRGRLQPTTSK